jgi:hypothetical protein
VFSDLIAVCARDLQAIAAAAVAVAIIIAAPLPYTYVKIVTAAAAVITVVSHRHRHCYCRHSGHGAWAGGPANGWGEEGRTQRTHFKLKN